MGRIGTLPILWRKLEIGFIYKPKQKHLGFYHDEMSFLLKKQG